MFKRLLIITCFGLLSTTAISQAAILALLIGDKVATEKFNISMELGGGLNSYSDVVPDQKMGLALNFGIGCNIMLNESWYINPSIYFLAQRKSQLENALVIQDEFTTGFPLTADAIFAVNYIDIPIFVNYRISDSSWRLGLAPQLSVSPKSSIEYEFNDKESYKRYDKENLQSAVFGMIASVSYVVSSGRDGKGLIIGLRYYQGLTDTFKNDFSLASGSSKASYIGLNMSFPFITDDLAAKNKKPKKD